MNKWKAQELFVVDCDLAVEHERAGRELRDRRRDVDLYLLWPGEVVGTPGSLKRHLCTALFALIALGLLVSGHYAIGSAVTVATALYGWL